MCDYSLGSIPTRLAAEGEELVVYRFPTGTTGLACPADLERRTSRLETPGKKLWRRIVDTLGYDFDDQTVPAICIPPSAFLILKDIPKKLQKKYDVQPEEGVTFIQIDTTLGGAYRDAFRFHNGREIRIQDLPRGLRVEVLSLAGIAEFDDGTLASVISAGETIPVPIAAQRADRVNAGVPRTR
jgi:hypothetical protein